MPSLLAWMFGLEYDKALRIDAGRSGYWSPTATEDLLSLPGVSGYLGLRPISKRELEILWVDDENPHKIKWERAVRGNWSRMSASGLLALYPALKVSRYYILRIPYVIREERLFLQLDQWKAVPSTPKGRTTAEKPRPRRRKRPVKRQTDEGSR